MMNRALRVAAVAGMLAGGVFAALYALALVGGVATDVVAATVEATKDGSRLLKETEVEISWGEWVGNLLALAGTAALAVLGTAWYFIRAALPAPVAIMLDPMVDRLIRESVDYAVNAVDGAAKGRTLTVDVGNRVVAEALRYLEDLGDKLTKRLGGDRALARKVIAYLDLQPEAQVVTDDLSGRPKIIKR